MAKGTNSLSWQKGPYHYQGKRDQLIIMAKGTKYISGQRGPIKYQDKTDPS